MLCPDTGENAPAEVTLQASKTNAREALAVGPSCGVNSFLLDDRGGLMLNDAGIERIASVPAATTSLSLRRLPMLKKLNSIDLKDAKSLYMIGVSEFDPAFIDGSDFPSSIEILALTEAPITSIAKLRLPERLLQFSMVSTSVASLKDVTFPASLTALRVHTNKLTALDFALPPKLLTLSLTRNPIAGFERLTLPSSLELFECAGCAVTAVRGVRWPRSLTSVVITQNPITIFEIRQSDLAIFDGLRSFEADFVLLRCDEGTMSAVRGSETRICVISDARFDELYGNGSSGGGGGGVSGGGVVAAPSTQTPGSTAGDIKNNATSGAAAEATGSGSLADTSMPTDSLDSANRVSTPLKSTFGGSSSGGSFAEGSQGNGQPPAGPNVAGVESRTPSSVDLINTSVASSSNTGLVLGALALVGALIAIVVAAFIYRSAVRKRRDKSVYTSIIEANETDSPRSESRLSIGDSNNYAGSAQEYLANDVRNDKALIPFRVDQTQIQLTEQIARGGFGVIYRAVYQGQEVAVKQMVPGGWQHDDMLASFMDEIRLCATLDHPKIVSFLGIAWNSLRDLSAIIEFMPGGDLSALLQRQHEPPSAEAWRAPWTPGKIRSKASIAQDVAEAVVYLHSFDLPVIHRDLKARNVLLDTEGNAKLSDFGISREVPLDETMTGAIGTAAWIAPEVLRGERYSEMADIYSLGVLLVELDRCCHPYSDELAQQGASVSDNEGVAMNNIQMALLVSTGKLRPRVSSVCPSEVVGLVSKCLSLEPVHRPSAMDVSYALRQFRKSSLHSLR